jgi:hypothetical protein
MNSYYISAFSAVIRLFFFVPSCLRGYIFRPFHLEAGAISFTRFPKSCTSFINHHDGA